MTRRSLVVFLSLIVLLVFTACGDSNKTMKQDAMVHSENDPIVIASARDVGRGNKDPYWTNLNLYVWEPLIGENDAGEIIPVLAVSWKRSDDAKKWTFELRKGVKFTDGTLFTSDVVVKNFERWKKISPASSTFFTLDINKTYPDFLQINALSDYSFELIFDKPIPMLPYAMLNWGSPMVSPLCFDEDSGIFNKTVVGTGQFKIVEHQPNAFTMLECNDDYWGAKAKTKYIKIRMIPEHDTRIAALRSGEIQGVYDNKAIQPLACKELEKEGFNISSKLSANIHYLQVNNGKFPFNDVRMKQAISLAVDRETLLNQVYGGYGKLSNNVLSPFSQFHYDTMVPRDIKRAKELAAEVLKGKTIDISLITVEQYSVDAQLIAENLKEIGLNIHIEIMDYPSQKERRKSGQYDMVISFRGMDNANPETMLYSFMGKDGKDNLNYGLNFSDDEISELLDILNKTYEEENRNELYKKIQILSSEKLPIITLFGVDTTVASSPDIEGYEAKWTGVTLFDTHWKK